MLDHLKINFNAKASPEAIVQEGPVRFTVLTSRLIRLEYDPSMVFEDRPTQIFWHRHQEVPKFKYHNDGKNLTVETDHLTLTYEQQDFGFYSRYLQIVLKDRGFLWNYGMENNSNLMGTVRTLDRINGSTHLNPGLISRTGWALVDDSHSLVFNPDGWLETRDAHPAAQDLYFFGYGIAYTDCVVDFQKISGRIPIIPRFALGNWWSRYWEYHQDELIQLMQSFQEKNIPLSVCIVDMDWHITETGNTSSGWTGYTWNHDLFPEPQNFLDSLDKMSLKTALNLHPASGVHPHEAQYEAMVERMNVDPKSEQTVPFDIADPDFTKAYFEILHHPLEEMGVDFWWIDWQQGTKTKVKGLDPLFWLNHLHFYDRARDGVTRPFIFSRWGGLGSQRYPIGFSGDTVATWETLNFQPYFTATAANVAYGWWSHDIGGHMGGVEDPELYLRWAQYGVFSPIFRLHATKNQFLDRRPWGHGCEVELHAANAMQLRHALIPYIYTAAWHNHQDGILPIRPMYHIYPEDQQAYLCPNQYTFGSELFAVPFTTPRDKNTRLSRQVVWLPEGDWFDFFTGMHYQGGGWKAVYGDLDQIPVFAKAGGIIPLGPFVGWGGIELPDTLTINIYPGANNTYQLYEDDGETLAYTEGQYAITTFNLAWSDERAVFSINPVHGDTILLSDKRIFKLVFHAITKPEDISIELDGDSIQHPWVYEEQSHLLTITDLVLPTASSLRVELNSKHNLLFTSDRRQNNSRDLLDRFKLDVNIKQAFLDEIDDFINNPMMLIKYADQMEDTHLLALIETWLEKQPDKMDDDPHEAFQRIINLLYEGY